MKKKSVKWIKFKWEDIWEDYFFMAFIIKYKKTIAYKKYTKLIAYKNIQNLLPIKNIQNLLLIKIYKIYCL